MSHADAALVVGLRLKAREKVVEILLFLELFRLYSISRTRLDSALITHRSQDAHQKCRPRQKIFTAENSTTAMGSKSDVDVDTCACHSHFLGQLSYSDCFCFRRGCEFSLHRHAESDQINFDEISFSEKITFLILIIKTSLLMKPLFLHHFSSE